GIKRSPLCPYFGATPKGARDRMEQSLCSQEHRAQAPDHPSDDEHRRADKDEPFWRPELREDEQHVRPLPPSQPPAYASTERVECGRRRGCARRIPPAATPDKFA